MSSDGGVDPVEHPVLAALTAAEAAVDAAAALGLWSLSTTDQARVAQALSRLTAKQDALLLGLLREVEAQGTYTPLAPTTPTWLRALTRRDLPAAKALCALAAATGPNGVALGAADAMRAGTAGAGHAAVLVSVMRQIDALPPGAVDPDLREDAQALLVEQAAVLEPAQLARTGRELVTRLAARVPSADDPAEAAAVAAEHERAQAEAALRQHERRRLDLLTAPDGLVHGTFVLEPVTAAALRAVLDSLSARRPVGDDGVRDERTATQRRADALAQACQLLLDSDCMPERRGSGPHVTLTFSWDTLTALHGTHPLTAGRAPAGAASPPQAPLSTGAPPPLPPFISASATPSTASPPMASSPASPPSTSPPSTSPPSTSPPSTSPPSTSPPSPAPPLASPAPVSLPATSNSPADDSLNEPAASARRCDSATEAPHAGPELGPLGRARLDDGTPLSPGEARRLLCDARVIPAVLGTDSQPLDLGRAARLATPAQHRALALRDEGCVRPGCSAPAQNCTPHHNRHWVDGGETNLHNLALLCEPCHRMVHLQGWQVRLGADQIAELVPPALIDPDRRPRRHARFAARRLVDGT